MRKIERFKSLNVLKVDADGVIIGRQAGGAR